MVSLGCATIQKICQINFDDRVVPSSVSMARSVRMDRLGGLVPAMPMYQQRDDNRRLLRWTATSPVTLAEVVARFEGLIADDLWHYGLVVDLRAAILRDSDPDTLLLRVRELAAQHGPHGPMALVTKQLTDVAAAQVYAMESTRAGLCVEVFWDIDDASRWVEAQKQ